MPAHALLDDRKSRPTADPALRAATEAAALYREGGRLRASGQHDAAIAAYDGALQLRPAFPEALRAAADILRELGNIDGALNFLAEAIRLRPGYVDAVLDRGNLLVAHMRFEEAIATFDAALAGVPPHADLLTNQGVALHGLGRLAEARACLERAIAADPQLPQAHLNHGNVLARLGRHGDALIAFDRTIALRPAYPAAHANRGLALTWLARFDDAADAFETALRLEPANAYARTNRARLRLLQGDFVSGLPDYEWRLKTEWQDVPLLDDVPRWSGQALTGLRVAAHADGGSGDVIHFARYMPRLVADAAEVTVVCRPRLQRLLRPVMDGARVVADLGEDAAFDIQIPFSSFPFAFDMSPRTVECEVPYLVAEADRVAAWAPRLGGRDFKVGVCWRGNQDWRADPHRSVPLDALAPLAALAGVRLISLQGSEHEAPDWPLERLPDLDAGPDGFLDTAAVMTQLDLIVTCDTSIAHLAGALGCPTCLMLQPVPEWRWMLERADSPWYPAMRLFRQRRTDDWGDVVEQVAAAIRERMAP